MHLNPIYPALPYPTDNFCYGIRIRWRMYRSGPGYDFLLVEAAPARGLLVNKDSVYVKWHAGGHLLGYCPPRK